VALSITWARRKQGLDDFVVGRTQEVTTLNDWT
jgi:hypothetical protein